MGINGGYSSVQYPRWLLATVGLTGILLGGGVSLGVRYASAEARLVAMQRVDKDIGDRVDTLRADVDALRAGRVEDGRLLRSLATLRCIDGTPMQLTRAAGVPCDQLTGGSR